MYEHGVDWTLTGSDGLTITLGATSNYRLEEVTGFDSPNVRQNLEDLPEQDGAAAGDFFFGSRPITLRGKIVAATAAERNTNVVNLQRALRGLRGNITLKSTPSGLPAMQAYARLENVRVTGGYIKEFMIGLVCADPLMYSQTLNTATNSTSPASPGATFPWAFPVLFGGGTGSSSSATVTNAGNFDAPAVIRVTGPVTNPQVSNSTLNQWIYLDGLTLVSGEWVEIDTGARTVKKSDGSSHYDKVRFPQSVWWRLAPGGNTVALWASTSSAGVSLTVSHRDVWA